MLLTVIYLRAIELHLPYEIIDNVQPDKSKARPALSPIRQTGIRFTYSEGETELTQHKSKFAKCY